MSLLEIFCVFILAQGIYAGSLSEHSIPGQPQLVSVETISPTVATISWFPPADQSVLVRGYQIGYGKNIPEENMVELDEYTLEYLLSDLEPGATYAIVVRAFNNRGYGLPVYEVIMQPPLGSNDAGTEIVLIGQPASQSSTHDKTKSTADKAVDGDTNGNYFANSCTHTTAETSPWWMVDMGETQCVGTVEIFNRNECCGFRLEGAIVRVGSDSNRGNEACGNPITLSQINANQKIEVTCDLHGRYLSIEVPGYTNLHVCEVRAVTGQCPGESTGGSPGTDGITDGDGITDSNGGGTDGGLVAPILSVTDTLTNAISVTWTGIQSATDQRGYKLRYKTRPPSTWESIITRDTSYTVTNLQPNTLYQFEVKVQTNEDESPYSLAVFQRTNDVDVECSSTDELEQDYRGTVAVTIDGKECQSWTAQSPHEHDRTPNNYPNAGLGDHNYCRNPDEHGGGAWCYTTDPETRFQNCDITQKCNSGSPSPPDTMEQPPTRCEPIKVELCSLALIPYNVTVLPNLFGHTSQDEINLEIRKWFPVAVTGCSSLIGLILCSTYVPACTILMDPIPPCREICSAVRNDCEGYMDFPWPEALNCDNFPSKSDPGAICINPDVVIPPGVLPGTGGPDGGPGGAVPPNCEPLEIEICNSPEIPYNYTMYPVTIGSTTITSQNNAMYESMMFRGIIESECSPVARFIVCSTIAPVCNPLGVPILPCRELCEMARDQCNAFFESSMTTWPELLACENFPAGPPGPDNQCLGFSTEGPGIETTPPAESQVCEDIPAGLEDGSFADELISASSQYGGREASQARLNGDNFWATANRNPSYYHYLQIDFGNETVVKGIQTQGSLPAVNQWVKTLEIELGDDEDILEPIQADGSVISFSANTDSTSIVNITFPEPVTTRILRIVPTDWRNWIAMRLEVILQVCTDVTTEEESPDDDKDRKKDGDEPIYLRPDIERGAPECEEFDEGVSYHCPGLEYNSTFFPNSFGHADQLEAIAALEMLRDVSDIMGRMCPANQLLCVILFPPCKEFDDGKAAPLLPCREECFYAKSECGVEVDFDDAFAFLSKWSDNLDCELFPEKYSSPPHCWETTNAFLLDGSKDCDGDKGQDGKDRKDTGDKDKDRKNESGGVVDGGGDTGGDAGGDICGNTDTDKGDGVCSTDIPEVCSAIGFKSTSYPNPFDHQDGTEALSVYEELQPAFDSMCSPELSSFVCAGLFPVCDQSGATFLPCHESCRRVWKACKDTFVDLGLDRPKVLSCNKYYQPVETDPTCLSSFNKPTKAPKLKNIDRQATNAKLVLWPEDDNAQYFDTKMFDNQLGGPSGPSREIEKKFNVSMETKTTSVTYEDLLPNVTYYTYIKTGNLFGESPSILETVPKFEGVHCQPLEIDMCRGFGYDMTLKDGTTNAFGHIDQAEAFDELVQYEPLINLQCSDQLQKFLCWSFVPGCSPDLNEIVPPCRESCEAALSGCQPTMQAFGYEWPEKLDCEQFPYSNESVCELDGGLRVKGERDAGVSDYICTKLFNSDPDLPIKWYNPDGEEISSEDPQDVIYIEKISERMTRLVITEYNADVAGKYTCKSGDLELGPELYYSGECYSNDHHICSNLYDSFNLPNSAGQTDPNEALLSTNVFLPLMVSGCSEYIIHFACYVFLPNSQCTTGAYVNDTFDRNEWGYGTTSYPCRELCYKVQQDCAEIIGEIGYVWPEDVSCDSLPLRSSKECDHYGVSSIDLIAVNFTDATNDTDLIDANATDIYPTEIMVTEIYTQETDYNTTEESPSNDTYPITPEPAGVCTGLKSRRYDMEDLGSDCLFRGFVDVQGQGAANDYCRVVKQSGPQFLSCALAGEVDDHIYTSPNASIDYFDAGYTDTWYMKDEDGDGRDDYCRCVGVPPDTIVSCMKADADGFIGFDDFQIEGSTGCEYNKVNPFFGAP